MNSIQNKLSSTPVGAGTHENLVGEARAACAKIAPLWPLKDFVAVNPFNGLTDRPFLDVCDLMAQLVPGGMQMPLDYYHTQFKAGAISVKDLEAALTQAPRVLGESWLPSLDEIDLASLTNGSPDDVDGVSILSVAEAVDTLSGSQWSSHVIEEIGQFCAAYFDERQSAWRFPWKSLPLYNAWREAAGIDANVEILGLSGFRKRVMAMPEHAEDAIVAALISLGLDTSTCENYLHKLLLTIRGWAGHVQYRVRENAMRGRDDTTLLQLLAIRLAYEPALLARFDSPALREFWTPTSDSPADHRIVLIQFLWQLAEENAWQRQLFQSLRLSRSADHPNSPIRPDVQAVFCIDVRSEVFRRALESASPGIETLGFAGFFGLPIEYIPFGKRHGSSQCPVLLTPQYCVHEHAVDVGLGVAALRRMRIGNRISHAWNAFKNSAISCFSFVETAGLWFGPKILRDAFFPKAPSAACSLAVRPSVDRATDASSTDGISLEDRVQLAIGALRNMGLTKNFARLVVLCGHGSHTTNNPYASSLDCGACGGHAGDSNARVGAAILNDPDVRLALADHGIPVPADTWFVAALHNTTTDEVTVFDVSEIPDSHRQDLRDFNRCLHVAGAGARGERAGMLGLDPCDPKLQDKILHRSLDWAQVRPEWGLAGNAAFIAAPRDRTKMSNFGGRVFLHNYDHATDSDDRTLELILCAPMVVANWINLQYFASTVNNAVFGSGNKITHNVVGTLGVCQGNAGDLQTGLPMQSVSDGSQPMHAPLRLHVVLEVSPGRIDAILAKHDAVRNLTENGWLKLFAMEDAGAMVHHRLPDGTWERVVIV